MDDEEPFRAEPSHMLSRSGAARLLGVTPSDLGHIVWIKGVPAFRIEDREYFLRRELLAAVDELFQECGELGARLFDFDPQGFVGKYDAKFPPGIRGEKAVRRRVMSAVFALDYRNAVWKVNFCCSIGLSGDETTRVADVMKDLGHLTKTGEIYRRVLKREF